MRLGIASLLCLVLPSVCVRAQVERPVAPAHVVAPRPLGVFACDDELVAIGPGYKAWLRSGGVDFVPALGAEAPPQQLHWHARQVRRGDQVVALASPAPRLRGPRCAAYDVGSGITEVYEAKPEGLEQSFVFAARPAGSGDLVVACEISTGMALVGNDGETVRFAAPGGAVTIGGVCGIDAAGRRVAGRLHVGDGRLELVLPAAFVDAASYPLVLDPVLGTALQFGPPDFVVRDVVFDAATNDWFVLLADDISLFDDDLYGLRVDAATGAPAGTTFPIDVASTAVVHPKAASVRSSARCAVAFLGGPTGNDVCVRTVNLATSAVSGLVVVATAGLSVAIGSEATTADDEVLVAWIDGDVKVAQVTIAAGVLPVAGAAQTVAPVALGLENVAISRTGGSSGTYLITWNSAGPFSGNSVQARAVSRNVAMLSPILTIASGGSATAVDTAGSTGLFTTGFLVAWQQFEPGSTQSYDIACAQVSYSSISGALSLGTGATIVQGTANVDEQAPQVAWLGGRYAVTFTDNAGSSSSNAAARLVNPDCSLCSARMNFIGTNPTTAWTAEYGARVCGRAAWIAGVDDGLVIYQEANPSTSASRAVTQRIETIGAGGAVTDLGGGCGLGGSVSAAPSGFALGNAAFEFSVSGLAAGALPLCCLAVPGPTITCGPCTFLSPLATFYEPSVAGTATHALAVPCSTAYFGFVVEVQWASLLTSSTPCPLVAGLAASNRVRLIVGL